MLDSEQWAKLQWPSVSFLDPRLHKRALNIATAILARPTTSIPGKFSLQKDVKGCYRFLDNKAIDHKMLQRQHYENVIKEASLENKRVLFIQDGSELIYNNLKWVELGPTADANGNGIMFHSCLAVKFKGEEPQVIGLAGQKTWIRERHNEKADPKTREEKESQVWQETIDQIGPVPEGCIWTTVGDRGADIFSFVEALPRGWDCVIRSNHDRKILVNGAIHSLKKYMRELSSMGATPLSLRARKGPKREVTLQINWAEVKVLPPKADKEKAAIDGAYVHVWCEEDPAIKWILFTRSRVTSLEEALEVVSIYRHRWLIEEYHKCLKTGCQIEKVQLRTSDRLLALFGMLGVVATQLIQLKGVSRTNPDELAENHVDPIAVALLEEIYALKTPLTVREFWIRVAMLAGFMGRKSDGSPGWKKIWEGWIHLRDMCKGVRLARSLAAKGF